MNSLQNTFKNNNKWTTEELIPLFCDHQQKHTDVSLKKCFSILNTIHSSNNWSWMGRLQAVGKDCSRWATWWTEVTWK